MSRGRLRRPIPRATRVPKQAERGRDDTSHADIGIVCALPIEMGAFLARCERVRKYVGSNFVFRGGTL